MKIFSRLKIISAEGENLLKIEDYEIYKDDSGWYNIKRKDQKSNVPSMYSMKPFKNFLTAYNFLQSKIYDYNTKNIVAIRKNLISKLHKLFKANGMQKAKDMTSRIRGYRPIIQNGYDIYIYPGDRTCFYIGFTKGSIEKEYRPKVLKILDKEGIKYNATGPNDIEVDITKQ